MSDSHTVRTRVPGQSVMSAVVHSQALAVPRSRAARIFGVNPLGPENRNWYRGALGELLVGDTLDQLGPEWDVLHGVPISSGNSKIDHLVIGPAGVFTVKTVNYSGQEVVVEGDTINVAGVRQQRIHDAQVDASRASTLLTAAAQRNVEVTPVVVIVNPQKLRIKEAPRGVAVLISRQLERWFSRLDRTLGGEDVAAISDVADRDSTWHAAPAPFADTEQLHRDFAVLRAEVNSAARCRLVWASAAFVVLCLGVWSGVAMAVAALVMH